MHHEPNRARLPLWHSLMYSTGILLIVCGIPGVIVAAIMLMFGRDHLDRSQALLFGSCMVGAVVIIGGILLFAAERITKRRLNKK